MVPSQSESTDSGKEFGVDLVCFSLSIRVSHKSTEGFESDLKKSKRIVR